MRLYKKQLFKLAILLILNTIIGDLEAQCPLNIGFDSAKFAPGWISVTDSNFISSTSNIYIKPGISPVVVNYNIKDFYLDTIKKPSSDCGNNLLRVGNRGIKATADTAYYSFIVDSLADKITLYSKGVSELAHNYWTSSVVEAPGFGYEIYVNGKKLNCIKGSFFCGNEDLPPVWQLGAFNDTLGVRLSTSWAKEVLNLSCYVGEKVEIRLFTRDCILKGHFAYAYFDLTCGDTSKVDISNISVNELISDDSVFMCNKTVSLSIDPQTNLCPLFNSEVKWTPSSFLQSADSLNTVIANVKASSWIFVSAKFNNSCGNLNLKDSIFINVTEDTSLSYEKTNINYCNCKLDTFDLTGVDIVSIVDENNNNLSINNDLLIVNICDKFYYNTFWKLPSSKIVTNNSGIGTSLLWQAGNTEGAISYDSLQSEGKIRFVIDSGSSKMFYAGINTTNTNNGNDIKHAIYYNAGSVDAYYNGNYISNLGTFTTFPIVVDFIIKSNRRVEIDINNTNYYSYSSSRRATFPVFADFSANSCDSNLISKTYILGSTSGVKEFNRLLNPIPIEYYINYKNKCGEMQKDTLTLLPGFNSNFIINDSNFCGLQTINLNINASTSNYSLTSTINGYGALFVTNKNIQYFPVLADFSLKPLTLKIEAVSGSCINTETIHININEIPISDAGPDINTYADTFIVGGNPTGYCLSCFTNLKYSWFPSSCFLDSSVSNPMVTIPNSPPEYLYLFLEDTVSHCFSFDTIILLFSLPLENIDLMTECTKNNKFEVNWTVKEANHFKSFGIDQFIENTWKNINTISSVSNVDMNYSIEIDATKNNNTLYRWYTIDNSNKKDNFTVFSNPCIANKETYTVYPNPFANNLSINFHYLKAKSAPIYIVIYNILGEVVYERSITSINKMLDFSIELEETDRLKSGIYFIKIIQNNEIVSKTKIVKQ